MLTNISPKLKVDIRRSKPSLEHQPIHVRGGYIVSVQEAGNCAIHVCEQCLTGEDSGAIPGSEPSRQCHDGWILSESSKFIASIESWMRGG